MVVIFTSVFGWLPQVHTVDLNHPQDCGAKFKSNIYAGMLPFVGVVAGNYFV
jgi:hypothetical protein